MKGQHTPGPWKHCHPFIATDPAPGMVNCGIHRQVIARVMTKGDNTSPLNWKCETVADLENVANAALIAAAPELLDALEQALKHLIAYRNLWILQGKEEDISVVWLDSIKKAESVIAKAKGEPTT